MKITIQFEGVPEKLQPQLKAMVERDVAEYPARFPLKAAKVVDVSQYAYEHEEPDDQVSSTNPQPEGVAGGEAEGEGQPAPEEVSVGDETVSGENQVGGGGEGGVNAQP